MKHVHREHNQEADHWADIGALGRRKIEIYRKQRANNMEAVRGFWDGSFADDGESGCGKVIKKIDRQMGDKKPDRSSSESECGFCG